MKAAECHMQNRSLFHAARCFEQVILILKEQNNLIEIEDLAHRACRLYQQQGSAEAGAGALDKAAKIIESTLPEAALNLYQHAVEVVMVCPIASRQYGANNSHPIFIFCCSSKIHHARLPNTQRRSHGYWYDLACTIRQPMHCVAKFA